MKSRTQVFLVLMAAALAGCASNAREVDFPAQRGYSADIAASLNRGPTAVQPGISGSQEPIGALPWQIGERHNTSP